jgi:tripartite ATP-independent transporter DctP family solute receptor
MPQISRRSLALGAAALPLFSIRGRPADAAEFTYKFANNTPVTHPMNVRAQEAANRIKEATGGRVEIQLFPNNQLGSDTDMLSQLRSGAIEFFTLSGLILSTLVRPASINGVGFAFKDYDQVWQAMDGKLGAYVRGEIEKRGLHPMDKIWDNGFRQTTTSTKPIKTPDDFKGVKLRVPVSPLWTSMFTALGASPASINFSEVYSALQTHIVDGQENPLNLIDTAKLYEVQKYCSLTNHMWDGFWFLANRRAWDRLPEDARQVVAREINAAAVAERADIDKANKDVKTALEGKGLVFNDVDTASFRERLKQAGFYKEWRGKYGEDAWHVLEESVGAIS